MNKLLSIALFFFIIGASAQDLNYTPGEILVQFEKNYRVQYLENDNPEIKITDSKLISRVMNIWKLSIDVTNLNRKGSHSGFIQQQECGYCSIKS